MLSLHKFFKPLPKSSEEGENEDQTEQSLKESGLPGLQDCEGLTRKQLRAANESVMREKKEHPGPADGKRGPYNQYSAEQRAQIGKYAAENGPERAARRFSSQLSLKVW